MTKPRIIQGALILLWGMQTDFFWLSIPMALLLEGRYYFNRRWALDKIDFYRVADLVSVALIAVILYLFFNSQSRHFIIDLVEWIPLITFPLVAIYAYSTSERMTLDVIFYSIRKQTEPVKQSWDLDYIYLGVCLISVGANPDSKQWFFPLAALVLVAALFPLRSHRYKTSVWLLTIAITLLFAFSTQFALRESHLALKAKSAQWISNWIRNRTDPLKTTTSLGKLGSLKLSDAIIFRVEAQDQSRAPSLMQEAVYDLPSGTNWLVLNTGFTTVPHLSDFSWQFGAAEKQQGDSGNHEIEASSAQALKLKMYLEFDGASALIPLPGNVSKISDLPATDIQQNFYGTSKAIGLVPSTFFNIQYRGKDSINSSPQPSDIYLPEEYERLFSHLPVQAESISHSEVLKTVHRFFSEYKYSLYQPEELSHHQPLEYFLKTKKSGHCEYFATATVLMLRHLGIPARYVVGYALQEYDPFLEMYLVRQRHAHAWAIAYVDGEWRVVDTTPSTWAEREAENESLLRPLLDFASNRLFAFQRWWEQQRLEDYQMELYALGALLILILAWRLYNSEQVVVDPSSEQGKFQPQEKQHLPFYKIEALLTKAGFTRGQGELLSHWLRRIGHPELTPLIKTHYKWRFDPLGASQDEKQHLESKINQWIAGTTDEE